MPILELLIQTYKLWQEYLLHFPKTSRYTLGAKIDTLFLASIEQLFIAAHSKPDKKLPHLKVAISNLDLLKFFLQVAWEIKTINNKRFIAISKNLLKIGRMLGGWQKDIIKKLPPEAEE